MQIQVELRVDDYLARLAVAVTGGGEDAGDALESISRAPKLRLSYFLSLHDQKGAPGFAGQDRLDDRHRHHTTTAPDQGAAPPGSGSQPERASPGQRERRTG